jgi:hypothetical protein
MIETLVRHPMTEFDEFFLEEDCNTREDSWIATLARRNFEHVRPLCYQLSLNFSFKSQLLYGTNFFSREDLVGIEPNPGPNTIVQYLKNMEKLEDFASTRKRSSSIAKVLGSVERKAEKKKTVKRDLERRFKNANFLPQGMFDGKVGVDDETKNFLNSLVDKFIHATTDIQINHNIDVGLTEKVSFALRTAMDFSGKAWNIILGFLKVLLKLINPALEEIMLLFLGSEQDHFYDAKEFQCEMNVPWQSMMSVIYVEAFCQCSQRGRLDSNDVNFVRN